MRPVNRREWLRWGIGTAGALAASGVSGRLGAQAKKEPIAITMWGGPYLDGARPLYEEFTKRTGIAVNVELHAGGAAAVVSRIKADLPRVTRDVVAAYDGVFIAMANEGWLDEITPAKVPRMSELYPLGRFTHADTGKVFSLGWTITESGWYYRTDLVPKDLQPLVSVEQLLDPRLKRRIYFRPPIVAVGANLISIAIAKGGDERNLEPGWKFVKDLASRGQIGGLPRSESEVYQALATGDGWITFGSFANAGVLVGNKLPVVRAKAAGLKSFVVSEGYSVLKGPRIEEAYEWMRFFYTAENIGRQCVATKQVPSHPKSPVDPIAGQFALTLEEQKEYVFRPDFMYVNTQLNDWVKRFEREILPMI